jgi:AraC-like DNA-binding protein
MQGRAAPVARFSTDDVAPRDRLALWRELVFQSALKVEISTEPDKPFRASAVVRQFPGLRALSGFSPPATYERSTAGMEVDEIAFQFGISEGVTARFSGREAAIGSGDAFLLPCGDRASIRVQESSHFTTLRLPRAAIADRVTSLGDAYCRGIPVSTPSLALLKRYLDLIDHDADVLAAPELQHSAVTHIYDLIVMSLGATRDAAEIAQGRGVRAARLKAIKDDIQRNLRNQSLCVGSISAHHNMTPRLVQKLFEETGVTFTEYVVAQRLARAHRLVTDPQLSKHTLTAIALEAGFSDLSYFNRAFRRRFGASPKEVRAE